MLVYQRLFIAYTPGGQGVHDGPTGHARLHLGRLPGCRGDLRGEFLYREEPGGIPRAAPGHRATLRNVGGEGKTSCNI